MYVINQTQFYNVQPVYSLNIQLYSPEIVFSQFKDST